MTLSLSSRPPFTPPLPRPLLSIRPVSVYDYAPTPTTRVSLLDSCYRLSTTPPLLSPLCLSYSLCLDYPCHSLGLHYLDLGYPTYPHLTTWVPPVSLLTPLLPHRRLSRYFDFYHLHFPYRTTTTSTSLPTSSPSFSTSPTLVPLSRPRPRDLPTPFTTTTSSIGLSHPGHPLNDSPLTRPFRRPRPSCVSRPDWTSVRVGEGSSKEA